MKRLFIIPPVVFGIGFILAGCQIEETPPERSGSIAVSAQDSAGNELIGGKIYLDNLERQETTPDTLTAIPIGGHLLKVKVQGFASAEESVTVVEDVVVPAEFVLSPVPFGFLVASSDPPGAFIIINREISYPAPYIYTQIDAGLHTLSAFLNGYLTLSPALDSLIVPPEDTVTVSFNLQAGTLGSSPGKVAPDFTLQDDFGDTISLHDYRGYIVLLTFFFSDCQPCMEEFPAIDSVYSDYAPYGVTVLGLDPMFYDDLQDVQAVRENTGVQFKLLMDYGNVVCYQQYNVTYYPTNIIVAPGGEIHIRIFGTSYQQLADIFDQILGLP